MKKQYAFVFIIWAAVCVLGALPYFLSGHAGNFTDALFESVSGFTTTGATVLLKKGESSNLPDWIFFFRSFSQWIGGLGVLFTFVVIPVYTTGGFQLKKIVTANSGSEKVLPRFHKFIFYLFIIYTSLTALQFFSLLLFGTNWFTALTQSFSTISTGGFFIQKNNIAIFNSASIEWIHIIFMFLSGINIYLIWLIFYGKAKNVFLNSEVRVYAGVILLASLVVTIMIVSQSSSAGTALRHAFFNVVSVISTTGFLTGDVTSWSFAAQGVLFFLLFIGGCSFSAAGGIKIIRFIMLGKQTLNELKRLVYPHGTFIIKLDGKRANKRAVHGAAGFIFLYFLILAAAALLVSSSGADILTSVITAAVCQGNIGLGTYIPFHEFPNYVKWGLCLVMIIGRLELSIALIIFNWNFWKR